MLTQWEIVRQRMLPPPGLVARNVAGALALLKIMRANPEALREARRREGPPLYNRPERKYDLPEFEHGMINRSSRDKYLRPTLFCGCRDPLITAMALRLGAGALPEQEFAAAAFDFVKRNIVFEIAPLVDAAEVLRLGTGTCLHKISLFIALCRAAGLQARYKFFTLTIMASYMDPEFERAPLFKMWYDAMGSFLFHGQGEVRIGGRWLSADVNNEPERQAASGLPLTYLGEESEGVWLFPLPGTTFWRESIPLGLHTPSRFVMKRLAAAIDGFNSGISEQIAQGRKAIAAAGGEQAYDAAARLRHCQGGAKDELAREHKSIVFGKQRLGRP